MRNRRVILIIIAAVLITAAITGVYFLTRTHYTYSIKYDVEITTTKEAYNLVNQYVQEKSPEAKIISYGFDMVGEEDILDKKPSRYTFNFDNSATGDLQEPPIERFFTTLYIEEKIIEIKYYKNTIPLGAIIEHAYPIIEIDIEKIFEVLRDKSEFANIENFLEQDSDAEVHISSVLNTVNYHCEINNWDVSVYSYDGKELEHFYVDLNKR